MNKTEATLTSDSIESRSRRAVLYVNSKSRRGQEWFENARTSLRDKGVELEHAQVFEKVDDLSAAVGRAVAEKVPLVIVGGGDGTISSVVHHFVGSDSVLGVLPLGTGNAFARDLGITADVESACRTIVEGRVEAVDLGFAGDDYFINVATIGLTTSIAKALTVDLKRKFGRFVYAIALAKAIRKVKPIKVRIETENGVQEFETLQLVIGNGRYHAGPFPLSPDASITDGKLTFYALATTNKIAFIKLALRLPTGHQVDLPEVRSQETTGGTLTSMPPMRVTVDGELNESTPMKFAIAPRALRVIVPQDFNN
ncbi:lipid kinase [Fimbriimonas ginsengisoli]|uniref:Putative lipid kinase n=1 Tax=Fimbriimonas ginsengisoli Gsoil 348 TaxID=661478 RepID=A0A068NY14_FIMGI|nr:lipid kinase [Fimbriimonas ginsengisoli]AIE86549.1 putative lipid kinase [Fimbriimonas ginsengisoli Gsoil 348]